MIEAPLAFAFGAGVIATVNPCGFAMLPAYLSYFVGTDPTRSRTHNQVQQSLIVGAAVSTGFLLVFGGLGFAMYHLSSTVYRWTPYATVVIGVAVVGLGIAMVGGFEPSVRLPKLERGGRTRTSGSMVLFGMSYAIASISCALPSFTTAVAGTFRRADLWSSLAVFGAYAAGMTVVLMALTVSLGLAKQGLVRGLRTASKRINRVSGFLLLVVGAYLVHYGWYERRVRSGDLRSSPVVDQVTDWSEDVGQWVLGFGPLRLGGVLTLGVALVVVLSRIRSTPD